MSTSEKGTLINQVWLGLRLALSGVGLWVPAMVLGGTLTPAPPQSMALPETTPGQLVREWMKLCLAPNLDKLTAWQTKNLSDEAVKRFPAPARAQQDFEMCTTNGGFRLVDVSNFEPNSISLELVGLKSGIWFVQRLMLNDGGKIVRAGLSPTEPAESTLPQALSDARIAKEVSKEVAKLSRLGLFSGIVTVARGTHIIASASGGYANRTRKTQITRSTQFTLGSMGKMFTAVAIGQLVDQRKISFDDTVGRFLPEYPNQTVRDKVTVGMLLSHTAGMGDFLGKRTPKMMKEGVRRADEFMSLYDNDEPRFSPGTNWAYSNAGLALAGAIAEKVSGEDYPDYIRKHIFAVAGMTNSDPNNIPYVGAKLATPYSQQTEQGPSSEWHEAEQDIGSPAGGTISTADDLVHFADALRSGKLLSSETFKEMTKPHSSTPGAQYGYALEIKDIYGRTIVGHGGGFPGVSTHLYLVLDSPYTVVILANQDPPADAYAGSTTVALMAKKAKLEK